MTYAIRNSIIIFGLIILVLVLNTITKNNTEKKLESVNIVYNEKVTELNNLKRINPDLEKEKEIMAQHDVMQTKALNRTKFILKEDNPTLSYAYFTSIAERFAGDIKFDFRYEGTGTILNTSYNQYNLKGSSNLDKVYRFLNNLENQSVLIKIKNVEFEETEENQYSMREKAEVRVRKIGFSITLYTFFDVNGKPYDDLTLQNIQVQSVPVNPFFAKIYPPRIDEIQSHLINSDNAKIVGLSQNTVTLKEGNKIAVLQPGDKVQHGILESINWKEEYVLFKLNSIGITVESKLYMERE